MSGWGFQSLWVSLRKAVFAFAFAILLAWSLAYAGALSLPELLGLFSSRFYLTQTEAGVRVSQRLLGRPITTQEDYLEFIARCQERTVTAAEKQDLIWDLERMYQRTELLNQRMAEVSSARVVRLAAKSLRFKVLDPSEPGFFAFVPEAPSQALKGAIQELSDPGAGRAIRMQPDQALPAPKLSTAIQVSSSKNLLAGDGALGDFGSKLLRSFEFIDLNDLLVAMARGDSAPWRRYDRPGLRPMLEKWETATGTSLKDPSLLGVYRTLSEDAHGGLRGTPIVAGGDIIAYGKGYYRVTLRQARLLEDHPLLQVELLPDPWSPNGRTYLGRHVYPCASTYRKFETLLSPKLRVKLRNAERTFDFADPNSPLMQGLTREVLAELIAKSPSHPLKEYQHLIAVHPFPDFNGRTMRAWYQRRSGSPLFIRNWDSDLFESFSELAAEAAMGKAHLQAIRQALLNEQFRNPGFPAFYDISEPWMIAAGLSEMNRISPTFVSRAKEWFRDPNHANLVRMKMDYEVFMGLRTYLGVGAKAH